ncbi:MAG: SpoIIE family protein phosphatase [Spirochaetales bacterium]|nr:SpoIIE family protein phosphatase [Spirochaetales bacterium]
MNVGAMKIRPEEEMILPNISYHKILDQIKDGIFITDVDRKIVYWNQGAEELTGFKNDDVLGEYCYDFKGLCNTDQKGFYLCELGTCPLEKALITNASCVYPHIVFIEKKNGKELPASINVGPIHDKNGKIVGGFCVFRDMSDEYRQMKLAGEIQKKMITLGKIRKNGVLIETFYEPVEEIGGDFMEAFFLDDKSLVATVADVTGHGISASLFTVIYKTLLHSSFSQLHNPSEVLHNVNEGFINTTQVEGYYLTASLIIFNPVTRRGKFVSARHPPGLIFKKNEKGYYLKQELSLQSIMIGVEENAYFQEMDFQLDKGEFLLLTSDGLWEAECTNDEFFGLNGIEEFLADYRGYDILNDMVKSLYEKSKYIEFQDDISMIKIEPVEDTSIDLQNF